MKQHAARVAALTAAVCEYLDLDERTRGEFVLSAYLHDIGKWAVPDAILRKPGPLNRHELRLLRQHTTVGAAMLRSTGLQAAATVALRHHEAWDGSGYPDGLKGNAIPFPARIIAVCDVYAALREFRPYRTGLAHQAAMRIMLNGDGSGRTRPDMFDPHVLQVFSKADALLAAAAESVPTDCTASDGDCWTGPSETCAAPLIGAGLAKPADGDAV